MSTKEIDVPEEYVNMAIRLMKIGDVREIASALAVRDTACALHVKAERLLSEPEDNATIQFLKKIEIREVSW